MPDVREEFKNSTKIAGFPGNQGQDLQADRLKEVTSHLLRKLQTSMDGEIILGWFLSSAATILGAMNCKLTTKDDEFSTSEVDKARHKANYNLRVENQALGTIEFSRNQWFSDEDLQTLEILLRYLVYPLKNALDYQHALDAALSDPLTGASNRRAFDYQIQREVAIANRYQSPLSLAVFDIDFFKKVNDQYGHAAGDLVLKSMVDTVKNNCRDTDSLFRLGGEEFALILTKTDPQGAFAIADRIRSAVAGTPICFDQQQIAVTISIGISTHIVGESKSSFTERADKAMYAAKTSGRNKTLLADAKVRKLDTENVSDLHPRLEGPLERGAARHGGTSSNKLSGTK